MCKVVTPSFKEIAAQILDRTELEEALEQAYLMGCEHGYLDTTQEPEDKESNA